MDQFDVMGQDIYDVNLETWRLRLSGDVATPKEFTYPEIHGLIGNQTRNK